MEKVVLVGYMGSGKSSVGKKMASTMDLPFVDMDELIEKKEGISINSLFVTKGEIYFRKVESEILKQILAKNDSFVLSLGGGTPCYFNNHELLKQNGVVSIYLKASAITLANRLKTERKTRPLLSNLNDDELIDYINKHLFDRSFYYHQVAHIISVDDKSITQIAAEIRDLLR